MEYLIIFIDYYYLFLPLIVLVLIWYGIIINNLDEKWEIYLENWDFDMAIKYFTKSNNFYNLWLCFMKKEEYNKAIFFYKKDIIKNTHWFWKQYYYIWYCYEKKNDYLNSFINYCKYIEINNEVPFYIKNSTLLNELSPTWNIESNYNYKNLDMDNFLKAFDYMKKSIKNNNNLEILNNK